MVEVLSSILPRTDGVGHFFLALDPGAFRERGAGEFEPALAALIDSLRGSTPIHPSVPVLVAGDPERAVAAERRRTGVPISRSVVEDLRGIARASGAPFVLESRG
jgi:LDH2 family malate/lactate/ureidoglycolate dehydrogenase